MKSVIVSLAATAAIASALAIPANADAGEVRVSINFGVPAVFCYPGVVYRPAVAHPHRPYAFYRPPPRFDRRYDYDHDRDRRLDNWRGRSRVDYYRSYAPVRAIEVRIDPHLRGR